MVKTHNIQRTADFTQACKEAIESTHGSKITAEKIANIAAASKPKGYYLSFDYALRRLRYMRTHPEHTYKYSSTARRMAEIDRRTANWQKHGFSDREALALVLADGWASSFFLSDAAAKRMYSKHAKHLRRNLSADKRPERL